MNRKEKIQQKVRRTLDCFEQAERLDSNPFFYTRVKARLEHLQKSESKVMGWEFAWSVLKPALLAGIVALNILTVSAFVKSRNLVSTDRQQQLSTFAQEFTLDTSQYNPNLLVNE